MRKGLANLGRHITNVRKFGVPAVVAINEFASDTAAEHALVRDFCRDEFGIEAIVCSHWADGSAGTEALAEHVVAMLDARAGAGFRCLYPDEMPLWDKMRTIATEIYGAEDIVADKRVRDQFKEFQDGGFGHFPICVAKTQYSFSTDPNLKGAVGPRRADPRDPAVGRRRVPRGDLRGDHDHAGPAARTRRPQHSPGRERADPRPVLRNQSAAAPTIVWRSATMGHGGPSLGSRAA